MNKGSVYPKEVPPPMLEAGTVLVRVAYSCISAGTETSALQEGRKSLFKKAIEQPEKIKKAFDILKNEGIDKTLSKIRGKLDSDSPIGYSLAGRVIEVGKGTYDLKVGDRVTCAGAGIANHAEIVCVPRNLIAKIPENLDFRSASTVALGSIALHGIRRAQIQLGEFVVIYGMGILGQIVLQMVKTAGGRCIAVDIDQRRLAIAEKFGAELFLNPTVDDLQKTIHHLTNGYGADAVIFTASSSNPDTLSQALSLARRKGKLVMIGVYGKEINREDLYNKELDFFISTSYGPGRYDEQYELKGLAYPYEYIRWTEGRNMQEYLRLLSSKTIDLEPIIEAVYPVNKAQEAFESLNRKPRPLIVLLDYSIPDEDSLDKAILHRNIPNTAVHGRPLKGEIRIGLIGAGSFATGVHLPNIKKLSDRYCLQAVCSRTGLKAKNTAEQFQARYSTTEPNEIFEDPDIDLVMICTRHDIHTTLTLKALNAGKHVFVEKPLCLYHTELDSLMRFYSEGVSGKPLLMAGFNRRFSKYAKEAKKHTEKRINPLFMHYRMNAGYIPLDHWVHKEEGGGRIIGEACHIIDLFTYFTQSQVKSFACGNLNPKTDSLSASDNMALFLEYENGSIATLDYFAVGSTLLPKEMMEIHFDEKSIVIDDYKSIKGYGITVADIKSPVSDKGHLEELEILSDHLNGLLEAWPIDLWDMFQTTELTLKTSI